MDEKEQLRKNRLQLKALLDANNYRGLRFGECAYIVTFTGKLRDWSIRTHIYNNWLCFSAFIMELPETPAARSALLERAMRLNNEMSVCKFSIAENSLRLELESRAESVDAAAFSGLMGVYYRNLEQQYAALSRLASGDETLAQLQNAFERPSLPAGAES